MNEFEERVEKLSEKYNIRYSRVYGLMTNNEIKLGLKHPVEYLFQRKTFDRKTYLVTQRQLYMQNKKNN